ncbi:hypothetical protein G5714_003462 [Onychostoma macrolepis]|uniref:Coilin n=1 Tax=Onychostoma macrolepis TaxID=369639 RepID=A0A7J6D9K3_9TELE|nr:hypothetical protein G5714_003462 [Onychostoma macrolepis]
MATSLNCVRVRLYFDYPPPATPECRMCWLLVDLNKCRVVADLSSIIKEKFGYSRRTILDLFIEDCYLPSTESIYIVRDNDGISQPPNLPPLKRTLKPRLLLKTTEKAFLLSPPVTKQHVKRLANQRQVLRTAVRVSLTIRPLHQNLNLNPSRMALPKSHGTKAHRLRMTQRDPKTTLLYSRFRLHLNYLAQPQNFHYRPRNAESSTDSSSSSPSLSQARTTAKKSQVSAQPSSATVQSVSSSVPKKPQDKPESSDSEASEIELVIKKPNLQGMGLKIAGLSPGVSEAAGRDRGNTRGQERGRGRGANRGSGRGGFGRAKGTPWKQDFHYNYENGERQKQNDSLTNESFILQNPPETAPKRDYAALPLLAAPPAVGQKIAFKLLELTENYTPEVSDYKEGKIIAFNPQTKVMELELISQTQAPAEPGKFDLVYQNPDGSERVEYAVTHGSQLTERWDSLLEPRLIVENVG